MSRSVTAPGATTQEGEAAAHDIDAVIAAFRLFSSSSVYIDKDSAFGASGKQVVSGDLTSSLAIYADSLLGRSRLPARW